MNSALYQPKHIDGLPSVERLTLTVEEVARVLGIGRIQAYNLTHRADFPAIRIGKRIVVPRDALMRWLDRQTEQALG